MNLEYDEKDVNHIRETVLKIYNNMNATDQMTSLFVNIDANLNNKNYNNLVKNYISLVSIPEVALYLRSINDRKYYTKQASKLISDIVNKCQLVKTNEDFYRELIKIQKMYKNMEYMFTENKYKEGIREFN